MNIVQLTPGTGNFHCGTCLRDLAMVRALKARGHSTLLVPLYLPLVADGADPSAGSDIFYGGVSVYLEQKSALFRRMPRWLDRLLTSRPLLRWAAKFAGSTKASQLGEMTISMLHGEEGRQRAELERLIDWLRRQPPPAVFCLSNGLLSGMARRLKEVFNVPVICMLQGEDCFLDALPEPQRSEAWEVNAQRAQDIDAFIAVSRYYGGLMGKRLRIGSDRLHIIHAGISLDGFTPAQAAPQPPAIGFLARLIPGKGLHTVIDAFIELKRSARVPGVQLRIAGSRTRAEEKYLNELHHKIQQAGVAADVQWHYNVSFEEKVKFLQSLSLLSVPVNYGESFGLYVLEAWACGVPVVQPRHGAFTELVEATGGGVLVDSFEPTAFAAAMERLLLEPVQAHAMGRRGRQAVEEHFNMTRMAGQVSGVIEQLRLGRPVAAR